MRSCCGVLLPNVLFAHKRVPGRTMRVGFDCWLGNAHKSPPPRPTCGPRIVGGRKDPAILLLGPNALSASADSSLRSFPSEVEDNVEECDMRAYAFGLASGPCGPNSSIQTRINKQRSAIVLQVPTPHMLKHWQAGGLSESCTKIGDVPKSLVPTQAALLPSAGKYTVQIVRFRERVAKAPAPRFIRRLRAASGSLAQNCPVKDFKVS